MMKPRPTCVIGQIIVDVNLGSADLLKMRLGGIVHAARTLWAMGAPYAIAYIAPAYLESAIQQYLTTHGCHEAICIGTVDGSPNVMLVREPKEVGSQGYEYILRDEHQCRMNVAAFEGLLRSVRPTDVVLFPGGFDLRLILKSLRDGKARIYSDANFRPYKLSDFKTLGRPFETLILSTSSDVFQKRYRGSFDTFVQEVHRRFASSVLLKENRGGSRYIGRGSRRVISVPAQVRLVQHSIGVGDCFDVVFVTLRRTRSDRVALAYASAIAAEYASTTYPDRFRDAVAGTLAIAPHDIISLRGVALPWERRSSINVYVAAPDFDYVDRDHIDRLVNALKYHNFTPRLPVREHGQMGIHADRNRRQKLCEADMRLLSDCQLVVAIPLFNDPGTLIEIGMAIEARKPVLVYDPFRRANNLILTELPYVVSPDLDEIIMGVFVSAAELKSA